MRSLEICKDSFVAPDRRLTAYIPDFSYVLFDFSRYPDDRIKGVILARVGRMLFKHVFTPCYEEKIPEILSLMQALLENRTGLQYIETIIRYILSTADTLAVTDLKQMVEENLSSTTPSRSSRPWSDRKGKRPMRFIDLKTQQARIRPRIEANIRAVLDHGQYVMGPKLFELERRLADYEGVRHAVSCASGTDALLMILMAHGVGPGDAVFTTPFTFVATAEVIRLLGAVPVFADIDPVTFNIDPARLAEAVATAAADPSGPRPRGIIPVDLFGLPADYDAVDAVAREHGLFVLEDAAQSFGAEYRGKKACALAHAAATSFFPAKPLGAYGDGGMCFTDDDRLAEALVSIRVHGMGRDKYDNVRVGVNGRMDTLQAAVLLAKFEIFPEEVALRQTVARRYAEGLRGVTVPAVPEDRRSAWAQYSILARDARHRGELQARLAADGIPTAVYYPFPLHRQTAFAPLGHRQGDFPVTEDCAARILSLPMHPYLTAGEQERIVDRVSKT